MPSEYTQHSPWSPKSAGPKESEQFTARSSRSSLQSSTPRSQSFRGTTHLIPSPGVGAAWPGPEQVEPWHLRWWIVYPTGLFMIVLGVVVVLARLGSVRYNGYHVPVKNAISFASPEFLTSFFPILLVAPLGWLWISIDSEVKSYYPYISMANGNVPAQDSVLLDYIRMNSIYVIWYSLMRRHRLVTLASLTYLPLLLLQPLAGALITINQVPTAIPSSAVNIRALGLDPSYPTLNNFLGAAGYADSAVTNDLEDPLFVLDQFVIAHFNAPYGQFITGNLTVNTTAIKSEPNCTLPSAIQLLPNADNFNLTANSTSGCSVLVPINQTSADQQYGITFVPNCGPNPAASIYIQPVFFWFFHTRMDTVSLRP